MGKRDRSHDCDFLQLFGLTLWCHCSEFGSVAVEVQSDSMEDQSECASRRGTVMDYSSWESREGPTAAAIRNGIRIRGRRFTPEELARIRTVVENSPGDHRFALSKRVC